MRPDVSRPTASCAARLAVHGPHRGGAQSSSFLGIAHGWAGIADGFPLARSNGLVHVTGYHLATRLDQLARLRPAAQGTACAGREAAMDREARSSDFVPSWCNGSAGFVHLWLAAERVWRRGLPRAGRSERRATPWARRRAGSTSAAGSPVVRMPCSPSTAERRRVLAEERAQSSLSAHGPRLRERGSRQPLQRRPWHGGLAAELPTPATASMPLFEAERW